jgi:hypothetical protein
MRHLQRKPTERGGVGRHHDVDDAGLPARIALVDLHDAGVRVRAPVHRDVQHARERDVRDVAAPPGHEACVLTAADLRAEQSFTHGGHDSRDGAGFGLPHVVSS